MATSKYTAIDIQNDDQEIDFNFQDFDQNTSKGMKSTDKEEQTIYFADFPDSATDDAEQRLLPEDGETSQKSTHSFWSFEYYQQYFDVESKQVGDRILWSACPKPGVNYLQAYIRPNPDLYGPFWVCITLVLTTAISGNIAEYLQTSNTGQWKYDFHKVTLAASLICSYAWLVPIMIWGALLWRGSKASLTLLELICIYGYSLSVFIPVSIIWTIPLIWLQWCTGIVATVLSGMVLIRTILPAVSLEAKKIAVATSIIILVLHAALALGFMLYFFYSPPIQPSTNTIMPNSPLNQTNSNLNNTNDAAHLVPNKPPDASKHERSSNESGAVINSLNPHESTAKPSEVQALPAKPQATEDKESNETLSKQNKFAQSSPQKDSSVDDKPPLINSNGSGADEKTIGHTTPLPKVESSGKINKPLTANKTDTKNVLKHVFDGSEKVKNILVSTSEPLGTTVKME